jgi:hypothetical protein
MPLKGYYQGTHLDVVDLAYEYLVRVAVGRAWQMKGIGKPPRCQKFRRIAIEYRGFDRALAPVARSLPSPRSAT